MSEENSNADNQQSRIRKSPLLTALGWVEHAFLPVGSSPPTSAAWTHQCHSATVILAEEAFPAGKCHADSIIATSAQPVAVYTADCLPVLIADERQHHVAAVHAGLKGALTGVLFTTVQRLLTLGATPDSLYAAIGPAIGPCCYELGLDVLENIRKNPYALSASWRAEQPHNHHAIRPQAPDSHQGIWFDLPRLGYQMLRQLGLPDSHINIVPVCTYCMAEPQSSYRHNTHSGKGYRTRYSWIQSSA